MNEERKTLQEQRVINELANEYIVQSQRHGGFAKFIKQSVKRKLEVHQ